MVNIDYIIKYYINCLYNYKNKERVKIHNEVIYIIDIEKPNSSYMILESSKRDEGGNKIIYVISFKEKSSLKIVTNNNY